MLMVTLNFRTENFDFFSTFRLCYRKYREIKITPILLCKLTKLFSYNYVLFILFSRDLIYSINNAKQTWRRSFFCRILPSTLTFLITLNKFTFGIIWVRTNSRNTIVFIIKSFFKNNIFIFALKKKKWCNNKYINS